MEMTDRINRHHELCICFGCLLVDVKCIQPDHCKPHMTASFRFSEPLSDSHMLSYVAIALLMYSRAQTEEYTKLIHARDSDAIMELLTDKVVEQRMVDRVRLKAATFGQDICTSGSPGVSCWLDFVEYATTYKSRSSLHATLPVFVILFVHSLISAFVVSQLMRPS